MPLIFVLAVYVGAIVAANLSIAAFGPWVSPINSFVLIGLDLTLRDRLHDKLSYERNFWLKMGAIIMLAAGVSYAINPAAGMVALASFVAFVAAGIADAVAYHLLRRRASTSGYMMRVNGSNVAGAAVDSILFATIAFGVFMPWIIALQFLAKVAGGFLWALVLRRMLITEVR